MRKTDRIACCNRHGYSKRLLTVTGTDTVSTTNQTAKYNSVNTWLYVSGLTVTTTDTVKEVFYG